MAFSRGVDVGSNLQPYSADGGYYWEEKSWVRFQSSTTLRNAAICAGVVPQQPPTMTTPALKSSGSHAAMFSGVSGYTHCPSICFGVPALGRTKRGRSVAERYAFTI